MFMSLKSQPSVDSQQVTYNVHVTQISALSRHSQQVTYNVRVTQVSILNQRGQQVISQNKLISLESWKRRTKFIFWFPNLNTVS